MAYGLLGHLGLTAQQSFGTAPAASYEFIPVLSESIQNTIEHLTSETLRARLAESPIYQGKEAIAGDIVMEANPIMIGHIFKGVFGQSSSSTTGAMSGTAYTHEFIPRQSDFDIYAAVPPYTIEAYRGVGSSWQFTDTVFNTINLELTAGAVAKLTVGVLAKTTSLMAKGTPTFSTATPLTWDATSISIAGAASINFESLTISVENQLEAKYLLDGTRRCAKFKRTGPQLVRVIGTLLFEDQTEYAAFLAQTEQRLLVNLDDTSITSLNNLLIDVPLMRYEAFPVGLGGPGELTVGFTAKGVYHTGSSYAIRITLVNSRTNGY